MKKKGNDNYWYVHILFPCSRDKEKLLKVEAECQEFAKNLRSLEQFIRAVKGQYNF